MTIEATGMTLKAWTTGSTMVLTQLWPLASAARIVALARARRKPPAMRSVEKAPAAHSFPCPSSSMSLTTTSTGDTMSILCETTTAAMCQTRSQKRMERALASLRLIVEVLRG